jgi:hypothetical protein
MQRALFVLFVFTASLVVGQNGFVTVIPDQPIDFLQVNDTNAWVSGHWVPVDPFDKKSEMTGPSVSEISCTRRVCNESSANITVIGNMFSLSSDNTEYSVERWDKKEIVASAVGGTCRVRTVLKFDREQKRVYWMQSLSEPVNDLPKMSQDACKLVGMYLELKASTMWRKQ